MSQASYTAKAVAAANQPADVDVMMADGHPQHQHRGCHITAPIPPLANNNHAYAWRDNGSDILFNNQPTMGECDGSSAFRLDLNENHR